MPTRRASSSSHLAACWSLAVLSAGAQGLLTLLFFCGHRHAEGGSVGVCGHIVDADDLPFRMGILPHAEVEARRFVPAAGRWISARPHKLSSRDRLRVGQVPPVANVFAADDGDHLFRFILVIHLVLADKRAVYEVYSPLRGVQNVQPRERLAYGDWFTISRRAIPSHLFATSDSFWSLLLAMTSAKLRYASAANL